MNAEIVLFTSRQNFIHMSYYFASTVGTYKICSNPGFIIKSRSFQCLYCPERSVVSGSLCPVFVWLRCFEEWSNHMFIYVPSYHIRISHNMDTQCHFLIITSNCVNTFLFMTYQERKVQFFQPIFSMWSLIIFNKSYFKVIENYLNATKCQNLKILDVWEVDRELEVSKHSNMCQC